MNKIQSIFFIRNAEENFFNDNRVNKIIQKELKSDTLIGSICKIRKFYIFDMAIIPPLPHTLQYIIFIFI